MPIRTKFYIKVSRETENKRRPQWNMANWIEANRILDNGMKKSIKKGTHLESHQQIDQRLVEITEAI